MHDLTGIDPWFLGQLEEVVQLAKDLQHGSPGCVSPSKAKQAGYDDCTLARLWSTTDEDERRQAEGRNNACISGIV